eukprot:COSAG01_NODE_12705_length_1697_cov_1.588235_1_plen_90_part_10
MIVFFKVVCCGRTVDARMIDLEDHPDLEFYNIVPDGYTLVSVRVCPIERDFSILNLALYHCAFERGALRTLEAAAQRLDCMGAVRQAAKV